MSVDYTAAPPPPAYVAPAPAQNAQNAQNTQDDNSDDTNAASDANSPDRNFNDIVYALLNKNGAAQASPLAQFLKQAVAASATGTAQTNPLNSTVAGQDGAAATATTGANLSLDPATAKKLADLLNHMLAGLPADQKNAVTSALQSGNAKDLSAALIATGLTPEKLAAMIEDLKKKDSAGDDLLAGTVQIVPAPIQRNSVLTTGGLGIQGAAKSGAGQKGDDDIEDVDSQVNPLMTDSNGDAVGATTAHGPGLENVLKIFEHAQQSTGAVAGTTTPVPGAATSSPANGAPAQNPAFSAGLSTIPGTTDTTGTLDFAGGSSGQIYPDGFDWSQKNSTSSIGAAAQAAGLTISGTAVATSLVSNAAQAITPHPATQAIATTIVKGAADGQSKDITLRLDPPELGKVEVKMTIDKDAGLKAQIVVEKPETYLMLQRDAHVLHQALNDAGLDVGGNALNFQLAQDGSAFSQNNSGGNSGNGGGGSAYAGGGSGGADNVLETTMNWQINPDTGQTHYNIWA